MTLVDYKNRNISSCRIKAVALFMVIIFIFLGSRVIYLQTFKNKKFDRLAKIQYHTSITINEPRGTIVDSEGKPLAISIDVQSSYIEPGKVKLKKGNLAKIATITGLDELSIINKIHSKKHFEWIMRHMHPRLAAELKELKIPGIGFITEKRRFYPNKYLAGQVLGFTGTDDRGLEGIELYYDNYLSGNKKTIILERDARGRIVQLGNTSESKGNKLTLTINNTFQHFAEAELESIVSTHKAKSGIIIIMDPSDGKILAMANYPLFNPNIFREYSANQWRNRAVTDLLEPGSTFKPFLVASALENKAISPNDKIFCENGEYALLNKTIHDVKKHGILTIPEILKYSSNIGATKISQRLKSSDYLSFIKRIGFGIKTGIDFSGEPAGVILPNDKIGTITLANMSFGQGLSTSPLQLITSFSALINGGALVKPYLVKSIESPEGKILYNGESTIERKQVISEKLSTALQSMLKGVVEPDGTGSKASIDGYVVVGKTGTAQKTIEGEGGYAEGKYISSFIGGVYAPDIKFTMLVIIDEPQGVTYGGTVAAPGFKTIAKKMLRTMKIPPTHTAPAFSQNEYALKDQASRQIVEKTLINKKTLLSGFSDDQKTLMPNLAGYSLREVIRLFKGTEVFLRTEGDGRVISQHPPAQSILAKGSQISLILR